MITIEQRGLMALLKEVYSTTSIATIRELVKQALGCEAFPIAHMSPEECRKVYDHVIKRQDVK